jgi:hypothetical protein
MYLIKANPANKMQSFPVLCIHVHRISPAVRQLGLKRQFCHSKLTKKEKKKKKQASPHQ